MTQQELDSLCVSDPVLAFCHRVNQLAPQHPEWNTNYCRALYYTFIVEFQKRIEEVSAALDSQKEQTR